jgi:hypothetical protein
LGAVERDATGINDVGQIVGSGLRNGQLRAILPTPKQPTPRVDAQLKASYIIASSA